MRDLAYSAPPGRLSRRVSHGPIINVIYSYKTTFGSPEMDVMIDLLNKLLSERDVKSWNCHQSDQIVFTVRFQLTGEEVRHLESLGIKSVVGNIGSDSRKVVTYKKKSNYQIDRDAKRSYGLIRKYNANSKPQPKQVNNSSSISPSVGSVRSRDSSCSSSSRGGNSPIRMPNANHPVKANPTEKKSSELAAPVSDICQVIDSNAASATVQSLEDQYTECLEEALELKSKVKSEEHSCVANLSEEGIRGMKVQYAEYAECLEKLLKLKSAYYSSNPD